MKKDYNLIKICLLLTIISVPDTSAQQAGIGTASPAAALDITSANEGLLIPRVALNSTNSLTVNAFPNTLDTPTASELVYNTATTTGPQGVTPGIYYLSTAAGPWIRLATAAEAMSIWKLGGNTGIDPAANFIGTKDNRDLVVKTNNSEAMRISSSGNVGIGTNSPTHKLEISAASDPAKLGGVSDQASNNAALTVDATGVVKKRGIFNLANNWVGDPATDNADGTAWRLQGIQILPPAADRVTINSPGTANEADVLALLQNTTIPKASCNFTVPYATSVKIDACFNLDDLTVQASQQPYVYFELYLGEGTGATPTGIFALTSPDYLPIGVSPAAFGHFNFSMSGILDLPAAGNYTLTLRSSMRYNDPGASPNFSRAVFVNSSNVVVLY